jgi:hypothetical protein
MKWTKKKHVCQIASSFSEKNEGVRGERERERVCVCVIERERESKRASEHVFPTLTSNFLFHFWHFFLFNQEKCQNGQKLEQLVEIEFQKNDFSMKLSKNIVETLFTIEGPI